jgi:hypothetical protein
MSTTQPSDTSKSELDSQTTGCDERRGSETDAKGAR